MQPLFHLVASADWDAAQAAGDLRPASLAAQGFVHLSTERQVVATANRLFRGRQDLVLLRIDPARLGDEVKFEEGEPGELFPHLYGPLPVSAVVHSAPLKPALDGSFSESL